MMTAQIVFKNEKSETAKAISGLIRNRLKVQI